MVSNGSVSVTSARDAEGLVTATLENADGTGPYTSSFGYDPDDDPITATLPGGVQEQQGYDDAGRLSTVALSTTATSALSDTFGYGYNPAGWTTAATSTLNGSPTTDLYTHDALGRLIGVQGSDGSSQNLVYDGNGNILTSAANGVTTTYYYAATQPNLLGAVSTPGQPLVHDRYDYQDGDVASITSTAGISTALSYDAQARPIQVVLADGSTVKLGYDASGRRAVETVQQSGNGAYTYVAQFSYRGAELGQAVIVSGTQQFTDTYLYTQDGAPLELIRRTKSGGSLSTSRYWYEVDGRGNAVATLLDPQQTPSLDQS